MRATFQKEVTEAAMLVLAASLARAVSERQASQPLVIFLHGPLGAGKTTFTRGFLQGLGFSGKVKSPTYTLVEPYEIAGVHVFHFDFYRLTAAEELHHIGIDDYFRVGAINLIEWPDKGFPLLPTPDLDCYIDFLGDARLIKFVAHSSQGKALLTQLS